MCQGLEPVCDEEDDGKEVATISEELRKWSREQVFKEDTDEAKKGRKGKNITGSRNYTLLLLWEKAIEFKYRSYLDNVGAQFSADTWAKWKIRFQRNWDETNHVFLACIVKLQKGEILYVAGQPFVSIVYVRFHGLKFLTFLNGISELSCRTFGGTVSAYHPGQ